MTFAYRIYTPAPRAPAKPVMRRSVYARMDVVVPVPKDVIVRSEPYRRLVAARPCKACGIWGLSQAAHVPPEGARLKQSDLLTFPLCCTRELITGCHVEFDQFRMFPRAQAVEQGMRWAAETADEIQADGLWPRNLPRLKGVAA